MRNLLIILILIFPSLILSQSATKWQQKNADKISSYVIEKMDLNTKDAAFFSKAQLAQIVENANNIKESGASTDEEKIKSDCDNDTILLTVKQIGPACHLGTKTCFDDE